MVASCVISTSVRWKIDVWRQHETLRFCHVHVHRRSSRHNTIGPVPPDGQRQLQAAHVHRPSTTIVPVISAVVTNTFLPPREIVKSSCPSAVPYHVPVTLTMYDVLKCSEELRTSEAGRLKNRRTPDERCKKIEEPTYRRTSHERNKKIDHRRTTNERKKEIVPMYRRVDVPKSDDELFRRAE